MGIVGAGTWGETHASIFHEHVCADLRAICDKDIHKARAVAEKYAIPEVYDDYREMAASGGIDAVSVVTPDFLHGDVAVAFAEQKKHLLIEKPIATTKHDIFRIMDAVEKNGVRAMVDLHNRWNPPFNTAKRQIESGALGTPYTAYFRLNDIKWVATDMLSWTAQSSILWFLGSHSLDTLRWLFDDEVKRVYSVKREGVMHELGIETPDIYLTTIEFSRGGVAQMENGWITPNGNGNWNDIKCDVLCTKGMVNIDASSHNLLRVVTEEKATVPDILVGNYVFDRCRGFSYESIRDFVDRLADGKPFRLTLDDAKNTSLAILAILESAESGVPVEVDFAKA